MGKTRSRKASAWSSRRWCAPRGQRPAGLTCA